MFAVCSSSVVCAVLMPMTKISLLWYWRYRISGESERIVDPRGAGWQTIRRLRSGSASA